MLATQELFKLLKDHQEFDEQVSEILQPSLFRLSPQ